MLDDNLRYLAKQLLDSYDVMYNLCYPEVERIINNQIKDINLIEHTLDQALDIYTEKGFNLFLKLVFYYSTIDTEKAYEYLNILKEIREEEYNEFIEKITREHEKQKKYVK